MVKTTVTNRNAAVKRKKATTMFKRNTLRTLTVALAVTGATTAVGCDKDKTTQENVGVAESEIAEVPHTDVERQSIGNCWLYAEASWVESMHLSYQKAHPDTGGDTNTCEHNLCEEGTLLDASCNSCAATVCEADPYCCETAWDHLCTGAVPRLCGADSCEAGGSTEPVEIAELDVSQSYWTYFHWYGQITGYFHGDEIQTGGNQWKSHSIIRDRGLMHEADFVPEDANSEMSDRQASAKNKINAALKSGGALATREARRDGKLVRQVFDDAWGLSPEVRQQLDAAFGEDGAGTLRDGGSVEGTKIVHPSKLNVRYTRWNGESSEVIDTTLVSAIRDWETVRYPSSSSQRRNFLRRVQRALHDGQPVVITWDVDFNAMENRDNERRGSFNLQTLKDLGRPGRMGGHMTVLGDYAGITQEFGLLKAGDTLDPNNPEDAAKLDALLLDSTEITLLRTKNSWGASRTDRAFAPGFPGYHDLWMDYLNGPIKFCPNVPNPTNESCTGETNPLRNVMLPPGY